MTTWSLDNTPNGQTLEQMIYGLQQNGNGDLIYDPICLQDARQFAMNSGGVFLNNDLPSEAIDGSQLDGIVIPASRLARTAITIQRVFNQQAADGAPSCDKYEIDQYRRNGITNIVVVFMFSDGQTVTIFFNNPDLTPNKIAPNDMLVSWRVLLNRMDVSIAVAPERGRDLPIRTVAARIMKLVGKNSAAFVKRNADYADRVAAQSDLENQVTAAQANLEATGRRIDELSMNVTTLTGTVADAMKQRDSLKAQLAALPPVHNAPTPENNDQSTADLQAAAAAATAAAADNANDPTLDTDNAASQSKIWGGVITKLSSLGWSISAEDNGDQTAIKTTQGDEPVNYFVKLDKPSNMAILTKDNDSDPLMNAALPATIPVPRADVDAVAQALDDAATKIMAAAQQTPALKTQSIMQYEQSMQDSLSKLGWNTSAFGTDTKDSGYTLEYDYTTIDKEIVDITDFKILKNNVGIGRIDSRGDMTPDDLATQIDSFVAADIAAAVNSDGNGGENKPVAGEGEDPVDRQMLNVDVALGSDGWTQGSEIESAATKGAFSVLLQKNQAGDDFFATINQDGDYHAEVGGGMSQSTDDFVAAINAATTGDTKTAPDGGVLVDQAITDKIIDLDTALRENEFFGDNQSWFMGNNLGADTLPLTKGVFDVNIKVSDDGSDFGVRVVNTETSAAHTIPSAKDMSVDQMISEINDFVNESSGGDGGDDLGWLTAAEADPSTLLDQAKFAEFQAAATIDPRVTTDPAITARFNAVMDQVTKLMIQAMQEKMSA